MRNAHMASDTETRRVLLGMVETGDLILVILTPRYLATWGLETLLMLGLAL